MNKRIALLALALLLIISSVKAAQAQSLTTSYVLTYDECVIVTENCARISGWWLDSAGDWTTTPPPGVGQPIYAYATFTLPNLNIIRSITIHWYVTLRPGDSTETALFHFTTPGVAEFSLTDDGSANVVTVGTLINVGSTSISMRVQGPGAHVSEIDIEQSPDTPTPTGSPSNTPTASITPTPSFTPTASDTPLPTSTLTPGPTITPTPTMGPPIASWTPAIVGPYASATLAGQGGGGGCTGGLFGYACFRNTPTPYALPAATPMPFIGRIGEAETADNIVNDYKFINSHHVVDAILEMFAILFVALLGRKAINNHTGYQHSGNNRAKRSRSK